MPKKGAVPVVYIITKLELGGAQKVCLSLFNEFQKKEFSTWLISGTQGPLVSTVSHLPTVFLLPTFGREVSLKKIGDEIRTFFSLIKILKKLSHDNPDLIVHTHSTKAGYLGRWAAFFARIPHRVHTVHGFPFYPYQNWLAYGIAYLLELCTSLVTSHYICVSTKDQATGIRLIPGFALKNSLIRAAVDDQKFITARVCKERFPSDPFIFGTVSCFKKQKNLFDLLEAFKQVYAQHPQARLELIGDGILRPQIEQWITKHELTEHITLHGWQQEVAESMKQWDVFVMSSLWEGLPCAAVEARFLKLPVVCYNVGGISDLIISGTNGFLYEPRNVTQLAAGMGSLLTDKTLFEKFTMHRDDLSPFTLSGMITQHSNLYHSIAKNE